MQRQTLWYKCHHFSFVIALSVIVNVIVHFIFLFSLSQELSLESFPCHYFLIYFGIQSQICVSSLVYIYKMTATIKSFLNHVWVVAKTHPKASAWHAPRLRPGWAPWESGEGKCTCREESSCHRLLDQGVCDFKNLEKSLPKLKFVSMICFILCCSLSSDPSVSLVHMHPRARKDYSEGQSLAFSD